MWVRFQFRSVGFPHTKEVLVLLREVHSGTNPIGYRVDHDPCTSDCVWDCIFVGYFECIGTRFQPMLVGGSGFWVMGVILNKWIVHKVYSATVSIDGVMIIVYDQWCHDDRVVLREGD